ncbi:MAG: membrane protein insertion efficiency factor YidD [Deltaproteobacteria bacterium]|nr:membrane protein insertion efficiency factor YidD [Deltaproteobacteria bacterium]MBW1794294.1 membrane protein insertion efficiency factor YidD [Deltaproteobacteria bacterium]MBW2330977.1 membrane protein insertion efficiency factor YidD [Deltaproteobacteria bacterium]
MKTRVLFPCITLLFLISGSANGVCASSFRGPWEEHPGCHSAVSGRPAINPLRSLVEVYRNYLSPIDGKTCPMYPSCSKYSLLCFEKHGFFVGWVMTCDRLLHEADEMRKAPVIYVNGAEKFHDPLENNDFWWHSER